MFVHAKGLPAGAFRMARQEVGILAVLILAAGGAWIFLALADEVQEGDTAGFDRAILLALRSPTDIANPIGPPWFESMVRDVTALGSNFVLSFVTLAVLGYLLLDRKRAATLLLLGSVGGGEILGNVLKLVFARARPDLVPHGVEVFTASFPSNHAMDSAITYLTLGVLLARLELKRRFKVYFLAVAVLLTLLVGASRLYLGVHWPTDVLAGWTLGAAWAMAVWLVALVLQRRGKVEATGN